MTNHQNERQLSVETAASLRTAREEDRTAVPVRHLKCQVRRRSSAAYALHVVDSWKQVSRTRPKPGKPEEPAGQTLFEAGSRMATHSTCEVIGNMRRQCRRPQPAVLAPIGPMQLTSNAERSRVSVNGRLPKPVIPRTIGSPPRLPASPLPRKQLRSPVQPSGSELRRR